MRKALLTGAMAAVSALMICRRSDKRPKSRSTRNARINRSVLEGATGVALIRYQGQA